MQPRILRLATALMSLSAGLLVTGVSASFAWQLNPLVNTAVCTAPGDQVHVQVTEDGSGGAILVWEDARGAHRDIYAQRLDANGVARWTANGVLVCGATGAQVDPQVVSDGMGGAVVVWSDHRNGGTHSLDVYAQRLASDGTPLWASGGVAVCVASQDQREVAIDTDGAGGVYVAWVDFRTDPSQSLANSRLYAQHISAAGLPTWAADGRQVGTFQNLGEVGVVRAGDGGMFVFHMRNPGTGTTRAIVSRLDASGNAVWSGIELTPGNSERRNLRATSDGLGGAIAAWVRVSGGGGGTYTINAHRVLLAGLQGWGGSGNGTDVATPPAVADLTLRSDGSGGAIIAWRNGATATSDIYGQHVMSDGTVDWAADGISLIARAGAEARPALVEDGAGGVFIAAQTDSAAPSSVVNVVAQRVAPAGTTVGPAGGISLCMAPGAQDSVVLVRSPNVGAIAVWSDARTPASGRDIYAGPVNLTLSSDSAPLVLALEPDAGPPGTVVTVRGSGFTGATSVYFGTTSAEFTVVSDTTLLATASGCGPVVVIGPGGTSFGGPQFGSAPLVTGLSPSAATVLTSIRISGSCLDGATAVSFNGVPSSSFVGSSSGELFAVVPGNATTGPVSVMNANGTGTSLGYFTVLPAAGELPGCFFEPPFPAYETASGPSDLALADLNLDARPDLVVAQPASGNVGVRFGIGDGSLGATSTFAAGTTPGMMATGDFDEDGRPDVLVGNGAAATFALLIAQPGGTLAPPLTTPVAGTIVRIAASDVNGDGHLDAVLLLSGTSPNVRVHPGDGTGHFGAAQGLYNAAAQQLVVAQVAGSALPDLVLGDPGSGTITLLTNLGGFAVDPLALSITPATGLQSIEVADATLDGRPDLLFTASGAPGVYRRRANAGAGTSFAAVESLATFAPASQPRQLRSTDINQDGIADLAVADPGAGVVWVLLARGDGTFDSPIDYPSAMLQPTLLAASDLDLDGRMDLLALSPALGSCSVLRNFGANRLFCPPAAKYPAIQRPVDLVATDLNHDGILDLAVADSASARIVVRLGTGAGKFGPAASINAQGPGPHSLLSGDANGDGHADLLYAVTDGHVRTLLGDGTGAFPISRQTSVDASKGLAIGRIDGDAFLDGVAGRTGGGNLGATLLHGVGDGTFTTASISIGATLEALALGRVDGDSLLDLVVGTDVQNDSNGIRILPGLANGGFGNPIVVGTAGDVDAVALAELTGDDRVDLIFGRRGSSAISVSAGLGGLAFAPATDYALPGAGQRAVTGDVNGDGWLDVVVPHAGLGRVSLFLNLRNGSLGERNDFDFFSSPVAAQIADVDGDFKNDLLLAEASHNQVSVVLNRGDFQAGTWLGGGIALGPGNGQRLSPVMTPDGEGGAFVGWRELRGSGDSDAYVQRLTSSGTIAVNWPVSGLPLTTAAGNQYLHGLASDGSLGVIAAWADSRDSTNGHGLDIYVKRADSTATLRWAPNGVPVCAATGDQRDPLIVPDGMGGAIVVWQDLRTAMPDYYAQRVDANGTALWATNGIPVSSVPGIRMQTTMESDGVGGVYLAWTEGAGNSRDILAQHIDASGARLWGPGGIVLCDAAGPQDSASVTTDFFGNLLVSWTDWRNGDPDVYWQRVDLSGQATWDAGGIQGTQEPGPQNQTTMESDGFRGAIIGWTDARGGEQDIYALRIDEHGQPAPGWPAGGVPVCAATGDQSSPTAITDGSGGAIFFWRDARNGELDLFAQRISPLGLPAPDWTQDGIPVCDVVGVQTAQQAVSDGAGGGIAVWQDGRSDTTTIFAARVDGAGETQIVEVPEPVALAGLVRFAGPWPNPAVGTMRFSLELARATDVRLEVFDVAGRRVRDVVPAGLFPPGRHLLAWDGRNAAGARVAGGVYFARLRAGATVLTRRCVYLR